MLIMKNGKKKLPVLVFVLIVLFTCIAGAEDGGPIELVVPDDELIRHQLVGLVIGTEAIAHLLVIALDGEAEDRPIGVHGSGVLRDRGKAGLERRVYFLFQRKNDDL